MPSQFLKRPEAQFDNALLRRFFADKRVLITGAAGTIGGALALKLAGNGCAHLGLLDFFDHGLIHTMDVVRRAAPDQPLTDALCDIRDRASLTEWMRRLEPDVVIHAAALKHVHFGERHPVPCVMTNLIGARNAMAAAADAGASHFVLVSSDKAAAPVCVMGASKRLAELFLIGFQKECGAKMRLRSVRFGNVLGSQGSVLPRFMEQIEAGGPLELTHPEMERFFMTAEEAVNFILSVTALEDADEAGANTYFMDMGEPVSIMALGQDLVESSGREIEIKVTGLRPGERLSEQLVDEHETVSPSSALGVYKVAPRVAGAVVTQADLARVESRARSFDDAATREGVFELLKKRLDGDTRARVAGGRLLGWSENLGFALVLLALGSAVLISELAGQALSSIRFPGLTTLAVLVLALAIFYVAAGLPNGRGEGRLTETWRQSIVRQGNSRLGLRILDVLVGTSLFLLGSMALELAGLL